MAWGPPMRIQVASRQGDVVLTLAGPLVLAAASRLQRAILVCGTRPVVAQGWALARLMR
jgi:hypothetical protein